jgi:hypothetical protein
MILRVLLVGLEAALQVVTALQEAEALERLVKVLQAAQR